MLTQNEDMIGAFDSMQDHLKIRITNQCNMKCRHCYVPKEQLDYEEEILHENLDWIEKCIKSPIIKYVHFQGGEPTLYPERMLLYSKLCQKHNKPYCIFTNGYLMSKDKNLIKFIKEEVKPGLICFSYNKYLQEQYDNITAVNNLIDEFLDSPIKTFSTAMIDNTNLKAFTHFIKMGGWPPYNPDYYPDIELKFKHKFFKFQLPLQAAGRGKEQAGDDVPYIEWPCNFISCDFSIAVHPNGILSADCGAGDYIIDILGHITQFMKLGPDPVEEVFKRRRVNFVKNPKGKFNSFYDICKKDKQFTCLKEYPK